MIKLILLVLLGLVLVTNDNAGRDRLREAMKHIEDRTCIRFRQRTNEPNYVVMQYDFNKGYCKLGQVIHELGHTLGFFHEQARPDRDNYVRIFLKNLAQKYKWAKGQFDKVDRRYVASRGVGYDYGSIMHYGKTAFAARGKITVQPKDRDARIGQRRALSNADIDQLSKMYNCAESKHVVKRAAMKSQWLWPGGVVFYKLSTNLDNDGKGRIRQAIRRIESKTCIRFRQRTNEANYVLMQYDFKKGYCGVGSIVHELGHCLGFFHEQSRPDRDNYVTIDLANLAPKYKNAKGNFDKVDRRYVDARGVDYDYGSMMHYGKYAFAARGKITIQPKDRKARIGQRRALSRADLQQLNKMYNFEIVKVLTHKARNPMIDQYLGTAMMVKVVLVLVAVVVISSVNDNAGKRRLQRAMRHIESRTCIKFRERTNEPNYVFMQYDFKDRYCGLGDVIHELGHTVGFFHEQARPDRDNYVTINLKNLAPAYKWAASNFDKVDRRWVDDRGVDYDYGSLMHYGKYAFAAHGKSARYADEVSVCPWARACVRGLTDTR
ncbi:hypothetical protein QZH41_006496 [Actinostola sp. cb2023]|nr:hypothetical protein QZH41_006496 [Actinostola sp. cb2023]